MEDGTVVVTAFAEAGEVGYGARGVVAIEFHLRGCVGCVGGVGGEGGKGVGGGPGGDGEKGVLLPFIREMFLSPLFLR